MIHFSAAWPMLCSGFLCGGAGMWAGDQWSPLRCMHAKRLPLGGRVVKEQFILQQQTSIRVWMLVCLCGPQTQCTDTVRIIAPSTNSVGMSFSPVLQIEMCYLLVWQLTSKNCPNVLALSKTRSSFSPSQNNGIPSPRMTGAILSMYSSMRLFFLTKSMI